MPDNAIPDPVLLPMFTAADVAQILNCHTRTVHREIARGRLAAISVGGVWRIRREAVAAYMNGGK